MEFIATISTGVTMLIATLGGFGWLITRMDRRFEQVDRRFEKVDEQFAEVRSEFANVRSEMSQLREELVEVKISVARLEGPQRRFISAH